MNQSFLDRLCPILGISGDQDQAIQVEKVKQFETALNANRIPNEIHIYPGVGHAFANPSGDNCAPQETADAKDISISKQIRVKFCNKD